MFNKRLDLQIIEIEFNLLVCNWSPISALSLNIFLFDTSIRDNQPQEWQIEWDSDCCLPREGGLRMQTLNRQLSDTWMHIPLPLTDCQLYLTWSREFLGTFFGLQLPLWASPFFLTFCTRASHSTFIVRQRVKVNDSSLECSLPFFFLFWCVSFFFFCFLPNILKESFFLVYYMFGSFFIYVFVRFPDQFHFESLGLSE